MRKYTDNGTSHFTPLGTYTNEPPLQNAELSAANLLSSGGIDLAKCSLKISGYSFMPSSQLRKTTPRLESVSWMLW
jgi:hypothetical protein